MDIYEVAKKAKVSIATVSRALSPKTRKKVAPETLKRVDAVVERYHYAPNLAARGLTQSVYHTIGVAVPHGEGFFMNEYYATILCGVADALLETPYRFKLLMFKCSERKWDRYDFKASEGIDGLILTHRNALFADKKTLKRLTIPCVMIGDPEKDVQGCFVSADQEAGGRLAAEYLFGRGHRNFAVMTGGDLSVDSQLRLKGFTDFLNAKGIDLEKENILCGEFQEKPAEEAMTSFLGPKRNITAVFCLNDTMAYGALKALEARGLKCPEDISVMGFDDDRRAANSRPPLTTVRVPLYEIAHKAAERLVALIETKPKGAIRNQWELSPLTVVERESVRQR